MSDFLLDTIGPAIERQVDHEVVMRTYRKRSWYFKQSAECTAMREMVRRLLLDSVDRPGIRRWTVQGFGMLRCYLDDDKRFRLNVWDDDLAVPGVSTIHDHPWHFNSWIISGSFVNRRYVTEVPISLDPSKPSDTDITGRVVDCMRIRTGEGGGPAGKIARGVLYQLPDEHYTAGDIYHQDAHEIHESLPLDGCVTLNDRCRLPDGEHALVFWSAGQKWVDAEPREATLGEIIRTLEYALNRWTVDREIVAHPLPHGEFDGL